MDKPYVKVNYANSIESDVLIFNNTKKIDFGICLLSIM